MATVTLEAVRKVYADSGYVAVDGIDLAVHDGEFVVLVGPSGCGKSTTLRMIAGLESITSGRLRIGERVVNALPPKERDIAMVFQGYALYPHMTVFENMAFALRLRKRSRAEIKTQVERAAGLLGLNEVLDRHRRQLSGGQRQRVAIGRAIAREPQVFLFDEPLSNLDAQLRADMRREIAALQRTLGATTIYVTHDQVEAMTLGQRIVILDAGRVQQVDTPLAIYERPANRFVGSFIGSPPMNLIDGEVTATGSGGGARFTSIGGALVLPLPTDRWAPVSAMTGARRRSVSVRRALPWCRSTLTTPHAHHSRRSRPAFSRVSSCWATMRSRMSGSVVTCYHSARCRPRCRRLARPSPCSLTPRACTCSIASRGGP